MQSSIELELNTSALTDEKKESTLGRAQYFISYAAIRLHSFMIITKRIEEIEGKNEVYQYDIVIASFSLYGTTSHKYVLASLCSGLFAEPGKVRSDHYLLGRCDASLRNKRWDRYQIGVKSFAIDKDKLFSFLEEVKKDAGSPLEMKDPKLEKKGEEPNGFHFLTKEEQDYFYYFRAINKTPCIGPRFNGRDFNCKKYILANLRFRLGIKDTALERDRFPSNQGSGLRSAFFNARGIYWYPDTDVELLNITDSKSVNTGTVYSKEYFNIFYQAENAVSGAICLLKDYSADTLYNNFFHPKRHHKKKVKECVAHIELHQDQFQTLASVINYVTGKVTIFRDVVGSLQKRLDFLEEQSSRDFQTSKTTFKL